MTPAFDAAGTIGTAPAHRNQARKAAIGSFVGAVVDWYDFLLYGIVAALVFNHAFFPNVSPTMGTLAAFATFGVGFLFRPLGGVVFGHYGDRLGRKRMLVLTVMLMGVSTVAIGLLPTFGTIGWWAPALLVALRAVQGFAVGGEWGGAALMAVESAPEKRRRSTAAACRSATASGSCSRRASCRSSATRSATPRFGRGAGGCRSCSASCSC
ncbi:sugar transporter family protein [Burkholderia thailandensis]|uniref:Sugar transporter family protein n=1 Tax=Burkholderia thailandensis TaxID=57975 RepID=A0AAW9CQG7_BURTH|nr:sugar transporter family protein [Burkholderia thailandensis]